MGALFIASILIVAVLFVFAVTYFIVTRTP